MGIQVALAGPLLQPVALPRLCKAFMIICICNNVSDRRIRQAVEDGMRSMVELRAHLDVGTCCGKCHACAKAVLRDCVEQAAMQDVAQPMIFHRDAVAA